MSELPTAITLLGEGTTNPALPSQNLTGTLEITNGNLVFTYGDFTHKIPLEHIDKLYWNFETTLWAAEWRFYLSVFLTLGTMFLALPVVYYLFYWEYTAYEVQIYVVAWDEYHGLNATTVFSLSRRRPDRDRVKHIIQEIWDKRGTNRRQDNSKNRVAVRDF
ncbi:MAG: hypothetical protein K8L97_20645 [Anaerolineae bacterium]|nr:hypothetical protein [Anaerolineae bacterium]